MAEIALSLPARARRDAVRRRSLIHDRLVNYVAAGLLVATVLFNPALAWVNAHLFPMTAGIVSAAQGSIVLTALLVGTMQPVQHSFRWLALTWIMVLSALLTSAIKGYFEPKILGDILLIPAFILLGTRIEGALLRQTMLSLQLLIMLVGLWELASPGGFGSTFRVIDYYVQTRGYDADAFWAGGDLFLSSERPGGRMLLDGLGLHRGSSLFLEPVSLGNWAIVGTIFTAAMWRSLSNGARLFMLVSTAVLLVTCDGRLALSVILLFCLYLPISAYVPDQWSVAYLPLLLVALVGGEALGILAEHQDNLPGRLSVGLDALRSMDLDQLLGIRADRVRFDDAGWADFVQAQSVVIAIGLWLALACSSFGRDPGNRMAKHGIMLFLALCLPISNSLLSIKTAALMWVVYGFCYARGRLTRMEGNAA